MARSITKGLEAESLAGQLSPFLLFEGAFEGGFLRLWNGLGDLMWDGRIWTGAGTLINISPIVESQDVTATVTRVSLNGMSLEVVALALGDNYQGRPAKVYIGALDEGSPSRNDIPNNTMQGAVVGTVGSGGSLPTGWVVAFNDAGFSIDIVATGVIEDIEYIDLRLYNPTAVGQLQIGFSTIPDIAAVLNDDRTLSYYITEQAGSQTGIGSTQLQHGFFTAGTAFIATNTVGFTLARGTLSANRKIFADTIDEAAAAFSQPRLVVKSSVITTPDLTVRIGLPQDEPGTEATSPIRTFGSAASRTRIVADPYLLFEGRMDVMEIDETGEAASISMSIESRLVDLDRSREWRYTDELQKQLFPGDVGLEFVPFLQDKEITWGT